MAETLLKSAKLVAPEKLDPATLARLRGEARREYLRGHVADPFAAPRQMWVCDVGNCYSLDDIGDRISDTCRDGRVRMALMATTVSVGTVAVAIDCI